MNINKALKMIRVFHDMKRNELATALDLSASYISEIEAGIKTPSLGTLEAYAAHFEMPLSHILFFAENIDQPVIERKLKNWVSSKVLAILEFIAANSNYSLEK
jgi:transcriptional regulator with XRE-family HTH domain